MTRRGVGLSDARAAGLLGVIRRALAVTVAAAGLALPVWAEGFETVLERGAFLRLVDGKTLTRLGIRLDVLATGAIRGRAFGRPVTGAWRWQDGYFCRDLSVGPQALGANCQVVMVRGDTLRFIADKGGGDQADLELR
ncbi:MAG: dihydrodipicolinate reductase [Rhodobacter sp.]|nr:dihydrodipicolinate reductase [Rhodobacter sp.]